MASSGRIHHGRTIDGVTPLISAILDDDADAVACLLELGADPTLPARDGTTPLALAQSLCRERAAALLQSVIDAASGYRGAPVRGAAVPASRNGDSLRERAVRWLKRLGV